MLASIYLRSMFAFHRLKLGQYYYEEITCIVLACLIAKSFAFIKVEKKIIATQASVPSFLGLSIASFFKTKKENKKE